VHGILEARTVTCASVREWPPTIDLARRPDFGNDTIRPGRTVAAERRRFAVRRLEVDVFSQTASSSFDWIEIVDYSRSLNSEPGTQG
jgi:hypothetical protein